MPSREPGAALLCALLLAASCTPGSLIDLSHNRQLHMALRLSATVRLPSRQGVSTWDRAFDSMALTGFPFSIFRSFSSFSISSISSNSCQRTVGCSTQVAW